MYLMFITKQFFDNPSTKITEECAYVNRPRGIKFNYAPLSLRNDIETYYISSSCVDLFTWMMLTCQCQFRSIPLARIKNLSWYEQNDEIRNYFMLVKEQELQVAVIPGGNFPFSNR
jgi:hypothetical protein